MKITKRILAAMLAVCALGSLSYGIVTGFASDTTYINMDFTYGSTDLFSNNGRVLKSIETDETTGNKYLKLAYNNPADTAPRYFDINYPSNGPSSTLRISGEIIMNFDVKFEGDDAAVYLKRRQEDINDIALRVCVREGGRLMYGTNNSLGYFHGANGDYFYPENKWYTVQIQANITDDASKALQSIYVTEKETKKLVTKIENQPITKPVPYCTILSVGASSTMCLDNIAVLNPDITGITISGDPYPSKSSGIRKYPYYTKAVTASGQMIYTTPSTWEIESSAGGVSIDPQTGELSVTSSAPVAPVIIKATHGTAVSRYLVEIEE
jgi:hypothetical protein